MSTYFTSLLFILYIKSSFNSKTEPTQFKQTTWGRVVEKSVSLLLYTEENMQKRLAVFLVIALVIAVANLPTAHGMSGGTGHWKRALQVCYNMYLFSLLSVFCENTRTITDLKLVFIKI